MGRVKENWRGMAVLLANNSIISRSLGLEAQGGEMVSRALGEKGTWKRAAWQQLWPLMEGVSHYLLGGEEGSKILCLHPSLPLNCCCRQISARSQREKSLFLQFLKFSFPGLEGSKEGWKVEPRGTVQNGGTSPPHPPEIGCDNVTDFAQCANFLGLP